MGAEPKDLYSGRIELDGIREVLRMYTRALTGINTQVMTSEELYNKGLGWVSLEAQELGGGAILLPDVVDALPTADQNFRVYKAFATHQSAHLEVGTLRFSFEEASRLFEDLRFHLPEPAKDEGQSTAFGRYFAAFTHHKLAMDIFNTFEDFRASGYLNREYQGIRDSYQQFLRDILNTRPHLDILPLREAAMEILFRYSIGSTVRYRLPEEYRPLIYQSAGLMNLLKESDAAVEDAAEAAIRAYCLLRRVPNIPASKYPRDHYTEVDLSSAIYDLAHDDMSYWISEFQEVNTGGRRGRRGDPLGRPGEVVYKGIPSAEFQRHLSFDYDESNAPRDLSLDDLDEPLLEELDADFQDGLPQTINLSILGRNPSLNGNGHGAVADIEQETEQVPGSAMDRGMCEGTAEAFIYPEWDCREEVYRPDWCTVWQRTLKEGTPEFFLETLGRYRDLVSTVEKRFEALRPDPFLRRRGLVDGDELDLDQLVESHVEKKASGRFNEKIYQRRQQSQRRVSLLFLLDMSISTGENIELTRRELANAGWGAYGNQENRRIIDVEKESLVVLTCALEKTGDRYGIYGFSGRGRDGTRFYTVKDMAEPLGLSVMARMDTIAPVQATRMGPAIRHATAILDAEPSRKKILVLISDGQPQDLNYGSDSEGDGPLTERLNPIVERELEKEYAVTDTHKALSLARSHGIVPHLLSIDRHGYDYLRIMCGGFGYEVVHDIRMLPQRLVSLYNLLTR